MVVLLVILGAALIVLGAVTLFWFPDRPGGVVRFHGVEVDSKGAGLPLMVVGAALAVAAVVVPGGTQGTTNTTEGSSEASSDSGDAEPQVTRLDVVPQTDCTKRFFVQDPAVDAARVRSVELDAEDRHVLAQGERQDTPFGMVLSDTLSAATPKVLGAVKLFHRPGVGFHIIGVVDEQTCQPVGVSLADEPGVPAPAGLGDYNWVLIRLGGQSYVLLLNSSNANTEVLVTLNRRG